jgi:hypothetical protein
MFTAWKKAKAVAGAKAVIGRVLSLLQYQPFGVGGSIPDQLWADSYFIGFFHNIVRYWSRLEFKREPTHDEFAEIFTRAVYEGCGSEENAKTALLTLVDSFTQVDKAGALAHENIGSLMARAIKGAGDSKEDINAAAKALNAHLGQAKKARDFVRGAEDGLICVNLVVGTNTYDQHPRVEEARQANVAIGGPHEGLAGSFLQLTIKQEYKERYTSR